MQYPKGGKIRKFSGGDWPPPPPHPWYDTTPNVLSPTTFCHLSTLCTVRSLSVHTPSPVSQWRILKQRPGVAFNFGPRGGKNRRAREHCSQEMLNSCRKFVWLKICYWKFEENLNTHVPLWAQQHMVDRHYSLNLKPWSARTLYVYAHIDLAQKYSVGLQEIFVSSKVLCSHKENFFFLPCLNPPQNLTRFIICFVF